MSAPRLVIDRDGREATVEEQPQSADGALVVRLADGTAIQFPAHLVEHSDGAPARVPLSFAEMTARTFVEAEERLDVHRRVRDTERVRVRTRTLEETQTVDEPLWREAVEVTRVPKDTYVDAQQPVRHEGDTTIVPVYEEVLVVEKRLLLREEVHIVRRREATRDPQDVTLRRTEVEVERVPLPPNP